MTTDKPNDDLEAQDAGPTAEAQPAMVDTASNPAQEPVSELVPGDGMQADRYAGLDLDVIEVGPPSLDDFVKNFALKVKQKHARLDHTARLENDGAVSNAGGALNDVIEITELGPSAKKKRSRRVGKNLTVTSLIKKGLEDKNLSELIEFEVLAIIDSHSALEKYEVVFLYDHTLINRTHASAVYQRLLDCDAAKNILLVLKSPGGQVEPAYLISKLCRRRSKDKFLVCVPGEAKSAATLLSLGADEIHMGAMSELGPIDPQINDYPALAFSSALDKIAQLAEKYPGASDMLAKYLIGSGMDVQALGHYDRIAESYSQYAINLLDSKVNATSASVAPGRKNSIELADYFTNHYKDHNFVIDVDEAIKQLGSEVVVVESDIYQACHEIHKFLESCEIALTLQKNSRRISVLGNKFVIRNA